MAETGRSGERETSDAKTVQFSVRLPVEHLSALERKAAEGDRSVSAEIRRLIRRYVEEPRDP